MKDPLIVQNVMVATLYGAGVVLFGASYAIFLALSRLDGMLHKRKLLSLVALFSYVLVALSTIGLVHSLQLRGWWLGLVGLMLIGYFLAPRFIWKLSHEMHSRE